MADCGEFTYQLIEYVNPSDLERAVLLRGQINSIDTANNQASITLLDDCPYVEGGGTITIPFWYHCEDSTGTLEDLEKGHKAFADGDMVYAVFIPVNGEVEQRFFIIGHVDIRDTKFCGIGEYILISTKSTLDTATWVTLFDAGQNRQFDLGAFQADDPSLSPPPPPTNFPVRWSTGLQAWLDYYFRQSVPKSGIALTRFSSVPPLSPTYLESSQEMVTTPSPNGVGIIKSVSEEIYKSSVNGDYKYGVMHTNEYFLQELRNGTWRNDWADAKWSGSVERVLPFEDVTFTDGTTFETVKYSFIRQQVFDEYWWQVAHIGDPVRYCEQYPVPAHGEGFAGSHSANLSYRVTVDGVTSAASQLHSYQYKWVQTTDGVKTEDIIRTIDYNNLSRDVLVGEMGVYALFSSRGVANIISSLTREGDRWYGYPFYGYEDGSWAQSITYWNPDSTQGRFLPYPLVSLYEEAESTLAEGEVLSAKDCMVNLNTPVAWPCRCTDSS